VLSFSLPSHSFTLRAPDAKPNQTPNQAAEPSQCLALRLMIAETVLFYSFRSLTSVLPAARRNAQSFNIIVRKASEARSERSGTTASERLYSFQHSFYCTFSIASFSPPASRSKPLSPTYFPSFDLWTAMINSSRDGATLRSIPFTFSLSAPFSSYIRRRANAHTYSFQTSFSLVQTPSRDKHVFKPPSLVEEGQQLIRIQCVFIFSSLSCAFSRLVSPPSALASVEPLSTTPLSTSLALAPALLFYPSLYLGRLPTLAVAI
jgi:hypothetical protein